MLVTQSMWFIKINFFLFAVNRNGIDSGGIFNDTIRITFEQFLCYKDTKQVGGDGKLFADGVKKLINPYLLVEFCDYLLVFRLY